jgi:sugar/nucleoside kinase (ribokinase family)
MKILVVGSIAFDSIETPYGKADKALGGSALYFSSSASYFAPVNIVGVVGEDFPLEELGFLKERKVDVEGIKIEKGKTFFWHGKYHLDMNNRDTIVTELNVFQNFEPVIPEKYRDSQYVFLANIDPDLQLRVLEQVKKPKLVVLDTMNFWISGKLDSLKAVLERVDIAILNESESRQISQDYNLIKASKFILNCGPKVVIIKKGEHGAILVGQNFYFAVPAYPLELVYDPTGAGDTFAGGFVGYLAKVDKVNLGNLKRAMIYGSVLASYNVEKFSIERFKTLTIDEIIKRFKEFKELTNFEQGEEFA